MELKAYLKILTDKWWLVISVFLITFTSGIVFTYSKSPLYTATATYIVVPGTSFKDVRDFTNSLDMLGRRDAIAMTFAEIAPSKRVNKLAIEQLGMASGKDYDVSSTLRAGTNIIEISVTGPAPQVCSDMANTIGNIVEDYVKGLYEVFVLVLLDEASPPHTPVSPNYSLNIILSAVLGLVLGGGLAFLSKYLEIPLDTVLSMNIIDDTTGVYNEEYFARRLSEEMVRARRNRYPLSLALMRIDNLSMLKGDNFERIHSELLQQIAVLTGQYLREEDIVAYIKNSTFAMLLPDMTGENAKALMEYLQTRVAWTPFESTLGVKFNLRSIVGITAYNHNGTSREELMSQAQRALALAEVGDDSKAFLIPGDQNE